MVNQLDKREEKCSLKEELSVHGFSTIPFSEELRGELLAHIIQHIQELAHPFIKEKNTQGVTLEEMALSVPDDIWATKMNRAFRIFPHHLSQSIHSWADSALREELGRCRTEINIIMPIEAKLNAKLNERSYAIYWRCVRPGKPDAGRPHRDSSFWELEFEQGLDPGVSFPFDYNKDCVKIWIPLKGCNPNTTLQVIPRSHKMTIPTTVVSTEYGARPTISDAWLAEHSKNFMSPIELSQGSCIIFDMNLVHRGPTHNNNELRISAELNLILN